jgi:(R)-2-hydroxyacyl-CoA dehydratese activating ATPase
MITAGCDLGSTTAKAVVLDNETLVASAVMPACLDPVESAERVMAMCLEKAGMNRDRLEKVVGTGYGQQQIFNVTRCESEITCHAKGAFYQNPHARLIIDIGGQDSKVTRIDEKGNVIRYSYNDKCAAGTGRFLEIMADALDVPLEEMGPAGLSCNELLNISNQCVIFAETEVVSLINEEKDVGDILNALFRAMAHRVASQARTLGIEETVVMTGGVAKNTGIVQALSQSMGVTVHTMNHGFDPQINGALGAALLAGER